MDHLLRLALILLSALFTSNYAHLPLDPSRGSEFGYTFEAFLSPWQEPGEEADTPDNVPEVFRSTTPSMTRAQRASANHRGHGIIQITKDLSRAVIDVQIEGIDVSQIVMFHIHCGKPTVLGPILVDFSLMTDIRQNFGDNGHFSVEVTGKDIETTANVGEDGDLIAEFSMGCFLPTLTLEGILPPKAKTVGNMVEIGYERELYFNLHTTGQTYVGDIRGQLHPITHTHHYSVPHP